MIFRIGKEGGIESYRSSWVPKELELERYILPRPDAEEPLLEESVFGEPLLLLSNQVRTRQSKRADTFCPRPDGEFGNRGTQTPGGELRAAFSRNTKVEK